MIAPRKLHSRAQTSAQLDNELLKSIQNSKPSQRSADLDHRGPDQLGLGLEDTRPDPTAIDPEEVRQELLEILALAKAATDEAPWDRRTHRYHQVVFPQMANWLPDDEADQLRFEFARELERIEALLAA